MIIQLNNKQNLGMFYNIFNKGKEREQKLEARQFFLDKNIEKSNNIQQKNSDVQKSIMEIVWKNQLLNEELTKLVSDNEKTKNILLERENKIRAINDELEERKKEVRKEEIVIEARKADLRKKEQIAEEKDKQLTSEETKVKEREFLAQQVKTESEAEKIKYQTLFNELENEKEIIKSLKEEALQKNIDADNKSAKANSIFEKARIIDEEIKEKQTKFEEYRDQIETSLNEKIAEYDRKLEDLSSLNNLVNDIKYDDSKDGKAAKIVVKEAIRQAKKALTDVKTKFEQLDEKYSSGTFKGFSTPIDEIDNCYKDLKAQYQQIKDHINANATLPISVSMWLESIEENIIKADTSIKSWEFSEAFRNIVLGLSTCKNYELLLKILNDWDSKSTGEENTSEDDEFIDCYKIFEIDPNASFEEIKKQYKELAKKYHPDKAPEDKQAEFHLKMIQINIAYEILSNPEKRKVYNEKLNNYK